MTEGGKMKLHSLLFSEETKLENIKLFPGTGRELSAETLGTAAEDALRCAMTAWRDGKHSVAPTVGGECQPLVG